MYDIHIVRGTAKKVEDTLNDMQRGCNLEILNFQYNSDKSCAVLVKTNGWIKR